MNGPGDEPKESNANDRANLRSLESRSTIPFGHVDPLEVQTALDEKYNQPLWKCLFENNPEKQVTVDSLLYPTSLWLDMRVEKGDITSVDPSMKDACDKAVHLKTLGENKHMFMEEKQKERDAELSKIAVAATAMIDLQLKKVKEFGGTTPPEQSPLFKVNHQNILTWQSNKNQLIEKAFQCVVDEWKRLDDAVTDHIRDMIEMAFSTWENRSQSDPEPGVDPELFGELEAILESQSTHPVT